MKKNALLFLLFFSHFITYGQNKFTISGFIMDAGSGEKLIQAHVIDSKSSSGTVSNVYGFYSITLPADSVNLIVSYIGYQAREYGIILDKNKTLNISLSQSIEIEEVKISAEKSARIEKETQMSIITIPIKQIKKIPSLLGETDVLKAMQLLPGVQSGGEGQSGLYVRGGSPDQNLILLDGVPVYNASHLFGFFSVFNAEAISDVKLIKGGFPARYGGRLSSVLDIRMKEGHKNEYHGNASIGLVSSKFTFEGPVIKDKTSFIVSGRRTYIDILARPLIKKGFSKAGENGTAGYYFYDVNAKINHKFSQKDRLYLSMYMGDDRFYSDNEHIDWDFKTKSDNNMGWGNIITAARWNHLWSGRLFSNATLTYSKYKLGTLFSYTTNDLVEKKLIEDTKFEYTSGIDDIALNIDFDYIPNPNHFIRFGASGIRHKFNPGVFDLMFLLDGDEGESKLDTIIGQKSMDAMELAAYIEDDYSISENLKINLGIHISGIEVEDQFYSSVQPRISMRYIMPRGFALKMSYAEMRQYIHLLAFSSIGLPTDLWLPTTKKVKPQDSWQAAIGLAKTINNNFDISIEGYYKKMNNVISYKEGAGLFQFDDWQERITQGEGYAYGLELFINKKRGKWTGWIGYTLSWAWRQFDDINFGKKYHYKYDRRHDISLVASYDITDNICFSGTWVFGTGNAITLANSSYHGFFPTDNGYVLNFETNHYPEKNNFRMKSYHRLDFGFDFMKEKKKYTRKWSVGAYNAYSRKNPFFLFIDKQYTYENEQQIIKKELKQTSLFPIIPYVTYSIDFKKKKYIMKNILIFLLLITLGSCEDFFQTTIKVDPPDFTTKLVVHMYINDANDTLKAGVSKSFGSLATVNSQDKFLVDDAIVRIRNKKDEIIYELNNITAGKDSNINYALVLNSNFNGHDQLFKLEISHPVLGIATAVQTMPRPVVISEPKFNKDAGVDVDGYKYSTVNFNIHDPAGQENYYQIKILFSDEAEDHSYYISSNSNDPIFYTSYDSDALLLSDKTFDGKDFPVKMQVDFHEDDYLQDKLIIDIKGISKDFYLYARSMYLYRESDDFGFTEPVSVYNNIGNGLGIFSLSSRKLYPVLF